MKVNPILEEFVDEYIRLIKIRGDKTLISRGMVYRDFLDICGSQGMSLSHIKKQITYTMNRKYTRRNPSHSYGPGGATWIIGGTMS